MFYLFFQYYICLTKLYGTEYKKKEIEKPRIYYVTMLICTISNLT